MNIKDLERGDILSVAGCEFKVTTVDLMRDLIYGYYPQYNKNNVSCVEARLAWPQPITTSWLRRIGFRKNHLTNNYNRYGITIRMAKSFGSTSEVSAFGVITRLSYKHELQHFMRMINKEEK